MYAKIMLYKYKIFIEGYNTSKIIIESQFFTLYWINDVGQLCWNIL